MSTASDQHRMFPSGGGAVQAYILSVICCALLCAVVSGIGAKKGSSAMILKLISGIFLVFTLIRPVSDMDLGDMEFRLPDLTENATYASNMGQTYAESQLEAIIKAETEAYILDKAQALQADVTVAVTLDGNHIPAALQISGQFTPRAMEELSRILETDLGIAKEDQIWNAS